MKFHPIRTLQSRRTAPLGLALTLSVATLAGSPQAAQAQTPSATAAVVAVPDAPDYASPEVSSDGCVTFRFFAPNARAVVVELDADNWTRHALTRDERGLWSYTTSPLSPNVYDYALRVDGLRTFDPRNSRTRPGTMSQVEVGGAVPQYFQVQNVPHGTLHSQWYNSRATGTQRRVRIYTPPGYEAAKGRYPVLYLLHGSGGDDEDWTRDIGRANLILDNLIASRRAVPMIVVMPQGHINIPNRKFERGETMTLFENDLIGDVMPLVERNFRTKKGRANRALAGLSMGGGQTAVVGFKHPELFGAYGVFSAGVWNDSTALFQSSIATLQRAQVGQKPSARPLLWIGIGKDDFVYERSNTLRERLNAAQIPFTYVETEGGHTWSNWRDYLNRFAPLLFRTSSR